MKTKIIIVSLMFLIIINMVNATTYYVNVSNPSCNDSYTKVNASNSSLSLCSVKKGLELMSSGDYMVIGCGDYNSDASIVNLSNKVITQNTTIHGVNSACVNVTRYETLGWANGSNNLWENKTGGWWKTNVSATMTNYPTVYLENLTKFFAFSNASKFFSSSYMSRYEYATYYNISATPDALWIKFKNTSLNPNNIKIFVSTDYPALLVANNNISNNSWIIIEGITTKYVKTGLEADNTSNVIFQNTVNRGGYEGIVCDGKNNTAITNCVYNNNINYGLISPWFNQFDMKEDALEETTAFSVKNYWGRVEVLNNTFRDWHGGIRIYNTQSGQGNNSEVAYNYFTGGYGTQMEIEDFCTNSRYHNNTVYNQSNGVAYGGVSFAPTNADAGRCTFDYNLIVSVGVDNSTGTLYNASCIKAEGRSLGKNVSNLIIDHNTFYCSGRALSTTGDVGLPDGAWANSNLTNNIFYSVGDYVLFMTGLASNGVYYNNNLYYHNTSSLNLLQRWNNNSVSGYMSLALALNSSDWDGTWDTNSVEAYPNFNNNYVPSGIACNMSSSGSYVGALPCAVAPSIVLNSPVGFVYTNSVLFNWTSTGATNVSLYINGTRYYYLPVTPLEDVSGSGHSLTGFGNLSFNSSEDAYYTQSNGYLQSDNFTMNNQSFTIAMDFKCFQNFSATFLMVKYDSSSAYETGLYVTGTSGINFYSRTVNKTLLASTASTICGASNNTWFNIVGTFNGSQSRLYVNGVLSGNDNTTNNIPSQINSTNNPLRIMRWNGKYSNGSVRNVVILNTSISASQVLLLNNSISPFAIAPNNVQVYYPFHNETIVNGSQTRVINLSDGSYNWFVNVSNGTSEVKSSINQFNVDTSGCIAPFTGMSITSDTTFCAGTFVLNHSLINETGAITIIGNVTLNGNGAVIQAGDYWYPNASTPNRYGIWTNNSGSNNIVNINNLTISGFNMNLDIEETVGGNISNVVCKNGLDHNFGTDNINNMIFNNITSYNSTNSGFYFYASGVTLSRSSNNNTIINSLFNLSNSNNCLHINVDQDANFSNTSFGNKIINNTFINCYTDADVSGTYNTLFDGNYFDNTSSSANLIIKRDVSFGNAHAVNTEVKNNIFNFGYTTLQFIERTTGTYVHDNTYNDRIKLYVTNDNSVDFRFVENTTQYVNVWFDTSNDSFIYFNYSGIKNISVVNNTINITTDGIYNDIRFINGTMIASNVGSYSLTLLSGQQVEVGDFVQEIVNPVFSVFGSLTIYNKDFYLY